MLLKDRRLSNVFIDSIDLLYLFIYSFIFWHHTDYHRSTKSEHPSVSCGDLLWKVEISENSYLQNKRKGIVGVEITFLFDFHAD